MSSRAPDFSQQIYDYEPCVRVGAIHPVPSMVLMVKFRKLSFPITFDNGATVSFMREDLARALGLNFKPNGQLASLADSRYRIKSLGEVSQLNPLQNSPLKILVHQYPLLRKLLKKLRNMKLCFKAHPSLLPQCHQQQLLRQS